MFIVSDSRPVRNLSSTSMFKTFWCLQALIGDGLLLSLSAAYVSDLISAGNRATALSLNLAGLSVAYTVGPIISGSLPVITSIWIAAGGSCLSVLMMLLFVKESASEDVKLQACPPPALHIQPCLDVIHERSPPLHTCVCIAIKLGNQYRII